MPSVHSTHRPSKRRKAVLPGPNPAWETTRQFRSDDRARPAALPLIAADGAVQRHARPRLPPPLLKAPIRKLSVRHLPSTDAPFSSSDATDLDPSRRGVRRPLPLARTRSRLEAFQKKLDTLDAVKSEIASLSSALVADPQTHVAKLTELRALATRTRGRAAALAILSEAQLYKDIVPGYRIRAISEKEAEVKVSKDIARLRTFESSLLNSYTRYVRFCISAARRANSDADAAVRRAAADALCNLLQALPHFNLADTITPAVCALASDRDPTVRTNASAALTAVLQDAHRASGPVLHTCMQIARALAAGANAHARVVPAEGIEPLSAIQFDRFARLPGSAKPKNAPKRSKRFNRKKRRKPGANDVSAADVDESELSRDLREADAEPTPQEMYVVRKSLLDSVCHAYFNIIKSAAAAVEASRAARSASARNSKQQRTRPPPPALAPALSGLLCVATYVPSAVLDATLAALTSLLEGGRLPLITQLRSLSAAYAILNSNAKTAAADANSFTADTRALDTALYSVLSKLFETGAPLFMEEEVACDAVDAILAATTFRKLPASRAAAIGRRLAVVSAAAPGHACAIGLLRAAQIVLEPAMVAPLFPQRRPDGQVEDVIAGDAGLAQRYDLETDDPDAADAERSAVWEMTAVLCHFHPAVREVAQKCAGGICGSRMPRTIEDVVSFTKGYSAAEGGFNPKPQEEPSVKTRRRKGGFVASELVAESEEDQEASTDFFLRVWDEQT